MMLDAEARKIGAEHAVPANFPYSADLFRDHARAGSDGATKVEGSA
jgi:hypothetical protein